MPSNHLLRRINVFVTAALGDLHEKLAWGMSGRSQCRKSAIALERCGASNAGRGA